VIGREARRLADDFAAELVALLGDRGWTWEELARRSGVSRTYLRNLADQRDRHGLPSASVVEKIAGAFDVQPDHFRITRARAVLSSPRAIDVVYQRLAGRS
jgi:transcriptional regulator with XRE-family HTH domain